jgi:VWFA-related protein
MTRRFRSKNQPSVFSRASAERPGDGASQRQHFHGGETCDGWAYASGDRSDGAGAARRSTTTIKAIDLLGRQQGRRSIDIFSDGDDQSSYASIDAAIARAAGSDATIYAIGQGRAVHASKLQDLLRKFATISGGRAFFTDDVVKLGAVFDEILEDLRNQYLLSYPAPSTRRDGAWHRIRVEVPGSKYHVRARLGRLAPHQQQP